MGCIRSENGSGFETNLCLSAINKANQQHGTGTKYYKDGSTDAGQWVKGVFQTDKFGYTSDKEATQSGNSAGLPFKNAVDGKAVMPKHNQIPMKQGGFGIPRSGLGTPMPDPSGAGIVSSHPTRHPEPAHASGG